MKKVFITLLSLVFIIGTSKSQDCTLYDPLTTNSYNFSSLSNIAFSGSSNGDSYWFSICSACSSCSNPNDAACQYATDGKWYDIGYLNNYQIKPLTNNRTGGSIVYGGSSSACPNRYRTTIINMHCENTPSTYIYSITESPVCTYNIDLYSSLACPTVAPTETPTQSPNITTTPSTPSPTVTTTPFPNNNGSVTTSTTTISDDDTTITQTITTRYSSLSYVISETNTTTITNSQGTNTITTTTIYENDGDVKVTITSTYIQGTTIKTNTFDSLKTQGNTHGFTDGKYQSDNQQYYTNGAMKMNSNFSFLFLTLAVFCYFYF